MPFLSESEIKDILAIVEEKVFRGMFQDSSTNPWSSFEKQYEDATTEYDLAHDLDFRYRVVIAIYHRIENCRMKFGKNWRNVCPTLKECHNVSIHTIS